VSSGRLNVARKKKTEEVSEKEFHKRTNIERNGIAPSIHGGQKKREKIPLRSVVRSEQPAGEQGRGSGEEWAPEREKRV